LRTDAGRTIAAAPLRFKHARYRGPRLKYVADEMPVELTEKKGASRDESNPVDAPPANERVCAMGRR
jgi:hypothetical protein